MTQLTEQRRMTSSIDQSQQRLLASRRKQYRHRRVTEPASVSGRIQPELDVPGVLSRRIRRTCVQRVHPVWQSALRTNQRQPVLEVSRPDAEPDQDRWLRTAHTGVSHDHDTVSVQSDLRSVNVAKKEDSNMSVLMRIMTNYLQMIAATLSFNLQFPNYLFDAFSSVKQAGNSSGVFLSFDCFLMATRVTEVFNNVSYLKVMCLGLVPIVILSVCICVLRVVFAGSRDKFNRWT